MSDGLPVPTFNILSRHNPIITTGIQRIGYTVQIKSCVIVIPLTYYHSLDKNSVYLLSIACHSLLIKQ